MVVRTFHRQISDMVNSAYGYQRLSSHEVEHRLAMGDAGDNANRVLHLAWRDGRRSKKPQLPVSRL